MRYTTQTIARAAAREQAALEGGTIKTIFDRLWAAELATRQAEIDRVGRGLVRDIDWIDRWDEGDTWDYHVDRGIDWHKYSKKWHRTYGPAHTVESVLICDRAALARPDALRGQTLHGLMTLESTPIKGHEGCYQAKWLEHGRGKNAAIRSGVIAIVGDQAAHAITIAEARALLRRRLRRSGGGVKRSEAEVLQARVLRLRRYWGTVVTLSDSSQAGNCPSGTRDWSARHLDGRETATVQEVLIAALGSGDRLPMAIAACFAAVRRGQKAARAAA